MGGQAQTQSFAIIIGSDDIYEKIYWGAEPFCSLLTAVPKLYARTVTINGVSKAYAMTGWRIGYCGGPEELIRAMAMIQGQSTSNPSSIAQKAAVSALDGNQTCVERMNQAFKMRHDFLVPALNELPGISCLPGAGTFYAWADVREAAAALSCRDDGEFAERLLVQSGVAVVPGESFGAPGHIRLSFSCDRRTLERGVKRIGNLLGAA